MPAPRAPRSLLPWAVIAAWAVGACGQQTQTPPRRVKQHEIASIELPGFEGDDPVASCVHGAGRVQDPLRRLVQTFCAEAQRLKIPGASMAVRPAASTISTVQWGKRCADTPGPIEADTRFALGSITKLATALVTLEAAQEHAVDLDSPIAALRLPGVAGPASPSLLQLLSHRGGTSTLDGGLMRSGEWRQALGATTPAFAPGELWHYSNFGYALAGAVLDEQIDGGFASLFDAYFRGRGLQLSLGVTELAEHACEHHFVNGGLVASLPRPLKDEAWLAPAGGARATAAALIELADLAKASERLVADPAETGEGDRYGLGVRIGVEDGHRIFSHRGATGSAWAMLMWDEQGNAIALVANREAQLDATVMAARRDVFGLEPEAPRAEPLQASSFAGEYRVAGWAAPVILRRQGEDMRLDLPELGAQGLRLESRADGAFRIRWPLTGLPLDLRLVKTADARWISSSLFVGRAPIDSAPG